MWFLVAQTILTEMRHAASPTGPPAQHIVHLSALLGTQEGRALGTKASGSFALWRPVELTEGSTIVIWGKG